jgi:hypothetical protein
LFFMGQVVNGMYLSNRKRKKKRKKENSGPLVDF